MTRDSVQITGPWTKALSSDWMGSAPNFLRKPSSVWARLQVQWPWQWTTWPPSLTFQVGSKSHLWLSCQNSWTIRAPYCQKCDWTSGVPPSVGPDRLWCGESCLSGCGRTIAGWSNSRWNQKLCPDSHEGQAATWDLHYFYFPFLQPYHPSWIWLRRPWSSGLRSGSVWHIKFLVEIV